MKTIDLILIALAIVAVTLTGTLLKDNTTAVASMTGITTLLMGYLIPKRYGKKSDRGSEPPPSKVPGDWREP